MTALASHHHPPSDASLRVEFERTHEWELILALSLVGAEFFAKSFCEELGEQLAQKLIQYLFPDGNARVSAGDDVNAPPLIQGDDTKSVEKVAESLGVSQMANVNKIEIIRLIQIHY